MRIMRKHYEAAEKQAGYTCIRCEAKRERMIRVGDHYEHRLPTEDVHAAEVFYEDLFCDFAWPGLYPVIYTTDDGDVLCGECAKRVFIMDREDVTSDIYYEGPTVQCDGCGREIESAYGDPDAEEESE